MSNEESQLKQTLVSGAGNIILPAGKMIFTNLHEAKTAKGYPDSKPTFGLALLIPPEADLKPLHDAINKALDDVFGAGVRPPKMNPIPVEAAENKKREGCEPGWILINMKADAKSKPGVVDTQGRSIDTSDGNEIYWGRWARASIDPFAYKKGDGGIRLTLRNVELRQHDERIGGGGMSAEQEFASVGTATSANDIFK